MAQKGGGGSSDGAKASVIRPWSTSTSNALTREVTSRDVMTVAGPVQDSDDDDPLEEYSATLDPAGKEKLMRSRVEYMKKCQTDEVVKEDELSRLMAPYMIKDSDKLPTRIVEMKNPKYPVRSLIPSKVTAMVKIMERKGWREGFATSNIVLNMPDRKTHVLDIVDGNHRVTALKIMQKRLQEMNKKGEKIPDKLKILLNPNFAMHVTTLFGAPRGLCIVIGQDYNETQESRVISNFYDSIVNTRSWMLCAFEDTIITPKQKKGGRPQKKGKGEEPTNASQQVEDVEMVDMEKPATFWQITRRYIMRYQVACMELAANIAFDADKKRIYSTAKTEGWTEEKTTKEIKSIKRMESKPERSEGYIGSRLSLIRYVYNFQINFNIA